MNSSTVILHGSIYPKFQKKYRAKNFNIGIQETPYIIRETTGKYGGNGSKLQVNYGKAKDGKLQQKEESGKEKR